jgi:hypothetical protein
VFVVPYLGCSETKIPDKFERFDKWLVDNKIKLPKLELKVKDIFSVSWYILQGFVLTKRAGCFL